MVSTPTCPVPSSSTLSPGRTYFRRALRRAMLVVSHRSSCDLGFTLMLNNSRATFGLVRNLRHAVRAGMNTGLIADLHLLVPCDGFVVRLREFVQPTRICLGSA